MFEEWFLNYRPDDIKTEKEDIKTEKEANKIKNKTVKKKSNKKTKKTGIFKFYSQKSRKNKKSIY